MRYSSGIISDYLRKSIPAFFFFILVFVLSVEVFTFIVAHTEGNTPLPATFGNFERVRGLLVSEEQREEFCFAVVGDTRVGPQIFEWICKELKDESLSFMVLLGDCVRKGTEGYHRYLRAEWGEDEELALRFPVFYVVGNHDVDREAFPISRFEEIYGPTTFSFDYQGCLFIGLRILNRPYSTRESLAFLESLLSAKRHDYRKVFVFMHIPPAISSDFSARTFENGEGLVALFDRFHVDYAIAGDYHGYARVKVRNTVYIVTGGGGTHLKQRKFGRFHHAIVIKVGENSVSERILFADKRKDIEDRAEELALAEVHPWIVNHWPAAIILNVGILGMFFWVFRGFLRNRRPSRSD